LTQDAAADDLDGRRKGSSSDSGALPPDPVRRRRGERGTESEPAPSICSNRGRAAPSRARRPESILGPAQQLSKPGPPLDMEERESMRTARRNTRSDPTGRVRALLKQLRSANLLPDAIDRWVSNMQRCWCLKRFKSARSVGDGSTGGVGRARRGAPRSRALKRFIQAVAEQSGRLISTGSRSESQWSCLGRSRSPRRTTALRVR
jgi:hypothetical protein